MEHMGGCYLNWKDYILSLPQIRDNYKTIQDESSFTPYLFGEVYNFKDFVAKHLLN